MKLNSAPHSTEKFEKGRGSRDDKSCLSEQEPARIGYKIPGTGETLRREEDQGPVLEKRTPLLSRNYNKDD